MTRGEAVDIVTLLREDYQHFPRDQRYELYDPGVYFKDPLSEFRGIKRFRQMVGLMERWFLNARMDLHDIQQRDRLITTRWTLSWNTPLPWKPRIAISGRSELTLNDEGLIVSHIDWWDCSIWDVVQQHWPFSNSFN